MTAEITIRPAQETDIDAIFALWCESMRYHEHMDPFVFGFDMTKAQEARKFISNHMDKDTSIVLVALKNTKVIGYLLGSICTRQPFMKLYEIGNIYDIVVTEAERRHGVGTLLMDKAFVFFKKRGHHTVLLSVSDTNSAALRFYEKHGFRTYVRNMVRKGL
jgi:ribosomal protein S18 acetylase RimI-like enzyme